jgi:hypothetical protein
MVVLAGLIVAFAAFHIARWAWRYQVRVLDAIGPVELLRRLEVRITAVLVHDRKVIVGVRDQTEGRSLQTLVVGIGREREAVVATLEGWCADGTRLQLEQDTSSDKVELRHLAGDRTLALRLAA